MTTLTPNHYVYAGPVGWKHFHLLLTTLIDNVNLTDITKINTIFACILFKGHNKDKQSSYLYRTSSTCPVVANTLDLYAESTTSLSGTKTKLSLNFKVKEAPTNWQPSLSQNASSTPCTI